MFYVDALVHQGRSLTIPYAGYQHFLPRLAAFFATAFDPAWAPSVTTAIAFGLLLFVLARLLSDRVLLPHRPWLALALILAPDAREVFFNLANLQWVLALGLMVLLLASDAQTRLSRFLDVAFAAAAGLTGPFSPLLAPLFVFRAWQRRSLMAVTIAVVMLATAAVQAWFLWHAPADGAAAAASVRWSIIPSLIGFRLGVLPLLGGLAPPPGASPWLALAGLLVLAAVVLLARQAYAAGRGLLAAGFALLLAAVLFRCRHFHADLLVAGAGERYFFILEVLLLWLLLAAGASGKGWLIATRAIFLTFVLLNLPAFQLSPFTNYHWADYAREIRAGRACSFPVNPPGMTINCPALPR